MLQITAQHRLYIAINFVNFRKRIDGLVSLCKQQLHQDPFSGQIFIFCNKSKTAVKILTYDGNGFWLCQKRFSQGKIKWWPGSTTEATNIRAIDLLVILQQGQPSALQVPAAWRQLQLN